MFTLVYVTLYVYIDVDVYVDVYSDIRYVYADKGELMFTLAIAIAQRIQYNGFEHIQYIRTIHI